jgi:hypothetical protein
MSIGKCAAHLGAAAVAVGLSLAVPQGVATADDTATGSSEPAVTESAAPAPSKSPIPRRAVRGADTAGRVAADRRAPVAASRSATARAVTAPAAARPTVKPNRTRAASPDTASLTPPTNDGRVPTPVASAVLDHTGSAESISTPTAAPASSSTTVASTENPTAPAVFRRAPRAAAAVSALATPFAGAATTSANDLLSELLSPIQGFVEGIALLVRRTFFNQAPSMSPVQITGQGQGLITGDLGAVDPEADPILFSITSNPQHGNVVIGSGGSYTYTPGQDFTGTDTFTVAAADTGLHINLLDLFRAPSTSANVVVRQGAAAAASLLQFQFFYGSGSQYWSPAARSSLEAAAGAIASHIVVSAPVIVTFDVTGEHNLLSATLATAGSDFISADSGFLPTVVQNKILTGVDSNGSAADGEINWNFAQPWVAGDSVAYGQYDLKSVAMHELLHTLGFLSYMDAPGANGGTSWTVFDSFLVNSSGTKLIGSDFTWNPDYNANLTGGSGGIFFGGSDAVAAYGGRVPLYTPSPWASGSSLSHLNDRVFAGGNRKLMNAQVGSGLGIRVISATELGVLADLGYTVTP